MDAILFAASIGFLVFLVVMVFAYAIAALLEKVDP